MTTYYGKGVCPGIAFGEAYFLKKEDADIPQTTDADALQEWERFEAAKTEADRQLAKLVEKVSCDIGQTQAMIADVQRVMLVDGDFNDVVAEWIKVKNVSAPYAVQQAGKKFADFFSSLSDEYMSARASDVEDMAGRVVDILLNRRRIPDFVKPTVVIADDLTPGETMQMDKSQVRGFVTRKGSSVSHTAILARTMNIPCVIQADIPQEISIDGKQVIVDGSEGVCYLEPDEITARKMKTLQYESNGQRILLENMKGKKTITKSGTIVKLYANIGTDDDLQSVIKNDAEGIGLFRSEFLYLGRDDYPAEDELFSAYKKVAEGMDGKKVIIRTLDIGADKKAEYFNLRQEENPALGLRGIRLCFERPDVFRTQLRAIYRASAFGDLAILFPMISSMWELCRCKEFAAQARDELISEAVAVGDAALGVMIETPAAVMIADDLAKEVEFFSVGTNDLTQYILAVDRQQGGELDCFYDKKHPAVLEMLRIIAKKAKENGIWAGICGEIASDPELTSELIAMGYSELSVPPPFVMGLRKRIREME